MLTVFKDDSIMAWDCHTLDFLYKLPVPTPERGADKLNLKSFSFSRDGRYLVGAGRTRQLLVWDLQSESLLRIIELPPETKGVREVWYTTDLLLLVEVVCVWACVCVYVHVRARACVYLLRVRACARRSMHAQQHDATLSVCK